MFKEERNETQFEWSMIGDIAEGRPNLGPMVHVAVYRLMQFTLRDVLVRDYGVEDADRIVFEAGKKAGEEYCHNMLTQKNDLTSFFADIQRTMKELGIGIFRVESADYDKGSFVVTSLFVRKKCAPMMRDLSPVCCSPTRARTLPSKRWTAGEPGGGSVVSPYSLNKVER